jgi:hypothetical protein
MRAGDFWSIPGIASVGVEPSENAIEAELVLLFES